MAYFQKAWLFTVDTQMFGPKAIIAPIRFHCQATEASSEMENNHLWDIASTDIW